MEIEVIEIQLRQVPCAWCQGSGKFYDGFNERWTFLSCVSCYGRGYENVEEVEVML